MERVEKFQRRLKSYEVIPVNSMEICVTASTWTSDWHQVFALLWAQEPPKGYPGDAQEPPDDAQGTMMQAEPEKLFGESNKDMKRLCWDRFEKFCMFMRCLFPRWFPKPSYAIPLIQASLRSNLEALWVPNSTWRRS